jgi:hypothetical protein
MDHDPKDGPLNMTLETERLARNINVLLERVEVLEQYMMAASLAWSVVRRQAFKPGFENSIAVLDGMHSVAKNS